MGTVPPCHGVARRGSFIWVMIPVPSMGSVCEVCVRGATVTLHDAPVDILFRCLEVLCHLLFPLCHRNGHRDVLPLVCPQSTSMAGTPTSRRSARAPPSQRGCWPPGPCARAPCPLTCPSSTRSWRTTSTAGSTILTHRPNLHKRRGSASSLKKMSVCTVGSTYSASRAVPVPRGGPEPRAGQAGAEESA
mgnify:FL=1